jgi:hypothetical protein
MRISLLLLLAFALAACISQAPPTATSMLVSADAPTSLAVGERITLQRTTPTARRGRDPVVMLTLRHADGRAMRFEEANHTAHDAMAQAAGGPLAQIMGLFGQEAPTLYTARGEHSTPFICGDQGPSSIGMYQAPDGAVQLVALKQPIQFETRPDGVEDALPYSPDQVCARLRFRQG